MQVTNLYEDKPVPAVFLMCCAVFCFTLIDSSAKWLVTAGLIPLQVTFVRYLGHFVSSLAFFLPREGVKIFVTQSYRVQIIRALFLMVGTFFNFIALKYLPLNVTIAIFFVSPLLISLLSIPILKEVVPIKQLLAVLVGFVGVLVIIKPDEFGFQFELVYSIAALVCASMYFVMTRLVARVDSNPVCQIYSSGIPTIIIFPLVISLWEWPSTLVDLILMVVIGCFATLGHSFTTIAYRWAKASFLAPVIYVQLIFMTIISWLVFDHLPTTNTIVGTIIIIFAGLYFFNFERNKNADLNI